MARLRSHLVEEAASIKKSEQARKQRELKKYGKEIQHEKLKQRQQDKKGLDERLRGVKRKRKDGAELGGDADGGDFDVALDDAIEGKGGKAGKGGKDGKDGKRGDKEAPRVRIFLSLCYRVGLGSHLSSRCRVTPVTASTEWEAAASEARRMTGNPQTTSTFQRARVGLEAPRAPKEKSTVRESRGGQIGDEREVRRPSDWSGVVWALYRHLCSSIFMAFFLHDGF